MPISDNKTIIRLDSQFFPDAQFRKAVCKQCKLKEGDVLSLDILSRIENLDLSSLFIDSLEGIEHFRYLKKLDISLNFLKALDISSLVYLENLNWTAITSPSSPSVHMNTCVSFPAGKTG